MTDRIEALRRRSKRLLENYGISLEEYQRLFEYQRGGCAICRRPPKKLPLAVDHCHATGLTRGLLCRACNEGLGKFRDDVTLLVRAGAYLRIPPGPLVLGERWGVRGRVTMRKKARLRSMRFVRRG